MAIAMLESGLALGAVNKSSFGVADLTFFTTFVATGLVGKIFLSLLIRIGSCYRRQPEVEFMEF